MGDGRDDILIHVGRNLLVLYIGTIDNTPKIYSYILPADNYDPDPLIGYYYDAANDVFLEESPEQPRLLPTGEFIDRMTNSEIGGIWGLTDNEGVLGWVAWFESQIEIDLVNSRTSIIFNTNPILAQLGQTRVDEILA